MRPLPRLLAVTDDAIVAAADFGIRTAAIAAAGGPAVGVVVRGAGPSAEARTALLRRVRALIGPPEAALVADEATAAVAERAHGVLIESGQSVEAARAAIGPGWVGVYVRDLAEARRAIAAGADWLVAPGTESTDPGAARPGDPVRGLTELVGLGAPVYVADPAIDRLPAVRAAGAWGVALTEAIWLAPDPARATEQILRTWL